MTAMPQDPNQTQNFRLHRAKTARREDILQAFERARAKEFPRPLIPGTPNDITLANTIKAVAAKAECPPWQLQLPMYTSRFGPGGLALAIATAKPRPPRSHHERQQHPGAYPARVQTNPSTFSDTTARAIQARADAKEAAKQARDRANDLIQRNEPEDLLPYRCRVMWRITRELGIVEGIFQTTETLDKQPVEKWYAAQARKPACSPLSEAGRRLNSILMEMQAHEIPVSLTPMHLTDYYNKPLEQITDEEVAAHDTYLWCYVELIKATADKLGIMDGSSWDPQQGRLGMYGLADHRTILQNCPTPEELRTFEQLLIEDTMKSLLREGVLRARTMLKVSYGMTDKEVARLLGMTTALARAIVSSDTEENRSMMVLRLDDLRNRCRKAFDMRLELHTLKQTAIISGLVKQAPDDEAGDFVEALRRVSKERSERVTVENVSQPMELE